jgi:hypothetical protein
MKKDTGEPMNWQEALEYAENLEYAGYDDWRLPNAKELQYIVDYSRAPDVTDSPAIDPIFQTSAILNEAGEKDYPFFWTSTTHLDGPRPGANAVYIAFGRALGKMHGHIMDVHGAGAQRSDPKTGQGTIWRGPQGDACRVKNYVRCVRGGTVAEESGITDIDHNLYPHSIEKIRGTRQKSYFAQDTDLMPESRFGEKGFDRRRRPMDQRPGEMSRPGFGKGRFIERLDRDGDGQVSRSEFDGPPDRFDFHDTDHSGYLTEDEAPKGPPPRRKRNKRPRQNSETE